MQLWPKNDTIITHADGNSGGSFHRQNQYCQKLQFSYCTCVQSNMESISVVVHSTPKFGEEQG